MNLGKIVTVMLFGSHFLEGETLSTGNNSSAHGTERHPEQWSGQSPVKFGDAIRFVKATPYRLPMQEVPHSKHPRTSPPSLPRPARQAPAQVSVPVPAPTLAPTATPDSEDPQVPVQAQIHRAIHRHLPEGLRIHPASLDRTSDPALCVTENQYVIALLYEQQVIASVINNLPLQTLLEKAIEFSCEDASSHTALARILLKARGYYGGNVGETISVATENWMIRRWICDNLFGESMETLLLRETAAATNGNRLSSRDLDRIMMQHALSKHMDLHDFKAWIVMHVLIPEVPMLASFQILQRHQDPDRERFMNMRLHDFEWGQIHAGLLFSKTLDPSLEVSIGEAADLGKILLAQLKSGVAPLAWWDLFRLPALLRYAQEHPELVRDLSLPMQAETEVFALQEYVLEHEQFLEQHCPVNKFKNVLHSYLTRPQLAKKIIDEKCPGLSVVRYLNRKKIRCITSSKRKLLNPLDKYKITDKTKKFMMPDIDILFRQQIDQIGHAYLELDKLMLTAALGQLDAAELDFIKTASLRQMRVYLSNLGSIRNAPFVAANGAAQKGLIIDLDASADFFSARRNKQPERIYAIGKQEHSYTVTRIDRHREHYLAFVPESKKALLNNETTLNIKVLDTSFKSKTQAASIAVDYIADLHRQRLTKTMYRSGYEETTQEKMIDFFLSLIPLYSCIDKIMGDDVVDAIFYCELSAISLLPVVGQLASLSLKVEPLLIEGGLRAARNAFVERTFRDSMWTLIHFSEEFIQHALLPAFKILTNEEMTVLGLTTLRSLDPGLNLITSLGRASIVQFLDFAKKLYQGAEGFEILVSNIESTLQKLKQTAHGGEFFNGRLAGVESELELVDLAGDQYRGQTVYARISSESGEPFGRKYILHDDDTVEAIPIEQARELKNTFVVPVHQGNAVRPPPPSPRISPENAISASLLKSLQQNMRTGESLEQLADRHQIAPGKLQQYLTEEGELTPYGKNLIDLAETGSSHAAAADTMVQQARQTAVRQAVKEISARETLPLERNGIAMPRFDAGTAVAKQFSVSDGKIKSIDGTYFQYDIDRDIFIKSSTEDSPYLYRIKNANGDLEEIDSEPPGRRLEEIDMDQCQRVIHALGVDLDLAAVLSSTPLEGVEKTLIPKQINFIWVGDGAIRHQDIVGMQTTRMIADQGNYSIRFYLSKQSWDKNAENLSDVLSSSNCCLLSERHQILKLEETDVYQRFKESKYFAQYQDAIDGNGGVATNHASAADILRFFILNDEKVGGGLYSDVDDVLRVEFGKSEFKAEANGLVLSAPLSFTDAGMESQLVTSFFGSHKNNPVIGEILEEMYQRYQQPEFQDFYKTARREKDSKEYARSLFRLTGPDVFNSVLNRHFPAIKQRIELDNLHKLCHRSYQSSLLKHLGSKLPSAEEVMPLANMHVVGNLHSWSHHR